LRRVAKTTGKLASSEESREQTALRPIQYQDRYLAFVDVLGFADLVKQSESSPLILGQIHSALASLSAASMSARSNALGLEVTSFSDTVVLSAPVGMEQLIRVIELIDDFSLALLSHSMLFRGAVVRGAILHKPEFIFGPALVAAYYLESASSFHPRIMLDGTTYADVVGAAEPHKTRLAQYVTVDPYDVPYLNPFARWQISSDIDHESMAQLVRLQEVIARGLMSGTSNPSVGEKYKWLGRKLNRFIRSATPKLSVQELPLD
jgi:hypothetical protein